MRQAPAAPNFRTPARPFALRQAMLALMLLLLAACSSAPRRPQPTYKESRSSLANLPALLWATGTFAASSRDLTHIPLPHVAAIVGLTYSWQAVVAGPTTGLAISNCVSYVHPAQ